MANEMGRLKVATKLQKRSLLVAINGLASLAIFFFGYGTLALTLTLARTFGSPQFPPPTHTSLLSLPKVCQAFLTTETRPRPHGLSKQFSDLHQDNVGAPRPFGELPIGGHKCRSERDKRKRTHEFFSAVLP